jgi:hypothetical protein
LSQQISTTPEAALLLACINVSSSSEDKSAAVDHLIRQPLDWDQFVQMVATHGLASIVCPVLKPKAGGNGVPSQAFAKLRYLDLAIAEKAARNARELVGLMTRFEAAGISALVFKGPALSVVAYGNPLLRDYSDLDILVHRSNVPLAAEVLMSNGFEVTTYNRKVFESGFFHNKSENFYSNQASVDLHWTLQDRWFPFGPDEQVLWSRTESFALNGHELRTLGAADHLLFLCVHAAKHGWPNLAYVVDIAAFLTAHPKLNVFLLTEDRERLGYKRVALLAFSLAQQLAGARLGREVPHILRKSSVRKLTADISSRLLLQSHPQSTYKRWKTVAATLESRSAQIRMFTLHTLTPVSDDYVRFPLRSAFYPLYYLIRPFRLVGQRALKTSVPSKIDDVSHSEA